jgi:hypothetical protein
MEEEERKGRTRVPMSVAVVDTIPPRLAVARAMTTAVTLLVIMASAMRMSILVKCIKSRRSPATLSPL